MARVVTPTQLADMGVQPPHTMFKLAFEERQPSRMPCATNGGEVCCSLDGGDTWIGRPSQPGGTQTYALERGRMGHGSPLDGVSFAQ